MKAKLISKTRSREVRAGYLTHDIKKYLDCLVGEKPSLVLLEDLLNTDLAKWR